MAIRELSKGIQYPPEEAKAIAPPLPFRLSVDGRIPRVVGQTEGGTTCVVFVEDDGRFVVVKAKPLQRLRGGFWKTIPH
jgi:hypothetical protein